MTEPDKDIYEAQVRSFEFTAVFYELPYFLGALIVGGGAGALYGLVVIHFREQFNPWAPLYVLLALLLCGLVFLFWGASYYPVRIKVFPDRLWFKMMFGTRELHWNNVLSVKALSDKDTRRTLTSPRFRSLSPAVSGAVLLARTKGRPWVINVDDREAFMQAVVKLGGVSTRGASEGND